MKPLARTWLRAAPQLRPWLLVVLLAVAIAPVALGASEASGYAVWPKWALILFCIGTVILSAMYCGLTIGLLGTETIYLEIIADAGQEPDRTYAAMILPVRKLGHQLLATLLLGNMLTLVLTSQLVAAIVNGSELVNFIAGTLVVLVFGEIIPMSFCNNQNNALFAGAKSLTALKVSLFVLYPIAKPLGLILDCTVGHDAGQVYDRQELKKLIRVHCEKFSDKSGIDTDQVRMMLSALEMNEVTVDAAMTPMRKAVMLEAEATLDTALERRLWEYGISRLPIYQKTRENVIGVLYIKDLINVSYLGRDTDMTVGEFIFQHPRDVYVVKADTLLQDVLHLFEHRQTQLVFVEALPETAEEAGREEQKEKEEKRSTVAGRDDPLSLTDGGGTPGDSKAPSETPAHRRRIRCGGWATTGDSCGSPMVFTPMALMKQGADRRPYVGIVTLEDVIEKLIASEIYDEDEYSNDVDEDLGSELFEGGALEPAPLRPPRVNFYSYTAEPKAEAAKSRLFDDQLWALAAYLTRAYVYFATWNVTHVRFLLNHVGNHVVYVEDSEEDRADSQSRNAAVLTNVLNEDIGTIAPERVLYRAGEPTTTFTVLLNGGIAVSIGKEKIAAELRSFSDLGEEILTADSAFVPDYTAIVSRTSRLLRITQHDIAETERQLNEIRARRRQKPIHLSPSAKTEIEVPLTAAPAVVVPPSALKSHKPSHMRGEDTRVTIE